MQYEQGSFGQFHNRLRILKNIDADELVEARVMALNDVREWASFRDNPFQFFIRADDETARRLWALVEKREAGK